MLGFMKERDIDQTLEYMSNVLFYVNYTAVPCYFGAKDVLLNDQWVRVLADTDNLIYGFARDFTINLIFNVGFIWTDIVMLTLATPRNTVSPYPFYMSFYVGDLIFRFFFKAEVDDNCWYPWNVCETAAEIDRIRQAEIDAINELG